MTTSNLSDNWLPMATISPATDDLMKDRVIKVLILALIAGLASVANVFVISSVLIEKKLHHRGNAFIVSVALADLIITGVAVPATTVALLANTSDWQLVTRIQWYSSVLVCFVTASSAAALAVDARLQLGCCTENYLSKVTASRIALALSFIWISSGISVGVLYLQFDGFNPFDNRKTFSWDAWRLSAVVFGVQFIFPTVLTSFFSLSTGISARRTSRPLRCSFQVKVKVFVVFVLFWLPVIVLVYLRNPEQSYKKVFPYLHWMAMSKSCLNPLVYAVGDKHFREGFVNLFHYCCCKTSAKLSRRARLDSLRPAADVRVHIIPGYNVRSSSALQQESMVAGSSNAENSSTGFSVANQVSAKSRRKSPREVYEL